MRLNDQYALMSLTLDTLIFIVQIDNIIIIYFVIKGPLC